MLRQNGNGWSLEEFLTEINDLQYNNEQVLLSPGGQQNSALACLLRDMYRMIHSIHTALPTTPGANGLGAMKPPSNEVVAASDTPVAGNSKFLEELPTMLEGALEKKAEAIKFHMDMHFARLSSLNGLAAQTVVGDNHPDGRHSTFESLAAYNHPDGKTMTPPESPMKAPLSPVKPSSITSSTDTAVCPVSAIGERRKAMEMNPTDSMRKQGSAAFEERFSHGMNDVFRMFNSEDLTMPLYHVDDYYSEKGVCQNWARSTWFHHLGVGVIIFNAIFLGIESDHNHATNLYLAHWFFIICENLFCVFFTWELGIRYGAFKQKCDFWRDGWCKFDFFLVLVMLVETWVLSPMLYLSTTSAEHKIPLEPLRLLRLLRLTRMTRLMKAFPELLTLTKSLVAGMRAVFSTLLFVGVLTYAFAIAFQALLGDKDDLNARLHHTNFRSVGGAMLTLTLDGSFLLETQHILVEMLEGDAMVRLGFVMFSIFILLSAVTLMNMLIGALCEVVTSIAQMEKDEADILSMKGSILDRLLAHDDGDGLITREELFSVMSDDISGATLQKLNIDIRFLAQVSVMLWSTPDAKIEVAAVLDFMLKCRGNLKVTVQHLAWAHDSLMTQLHDMFDATAGHGSAGLKLAHHESLQSNRSTFKV